MPSIKNKGEEQIQLNIKRDDERRLFDEPYGKVCVFDDAVEILLFNGHNYNGAITIRLNALRMCSVNYVFETGTGPNLISEEMVEPD